MKLRHPLRLDHATHPGKADPYRADCLHRLQREEWGKFCTEHCPHPGKLCRQPCKEWRAKFGNRRDA